MSILGSISNSFKKVAGANNPHLNTNINQLQNESYTRNPQKNPNFNPNALVDADNDGIADVLETKHHREFGDGIPRQDKLKPFSFKEPRKDYNQSFDKKGRYVVTATYPLPPLSHQNKMIDRNRKLNNKQNKFL
jgi:hypothetical protein